MKRLLVAIFLVTLSLLSPLSFALPAPKDIAAAINSGRLSDAEAMLHEVIQAKPESAKAHYELGQVLAREGRKIEARQELLEARRLDPSLKFASDPQHFRGLLENLDRAPGTVASAHVPAFTPTTQNSSPITVAHANAEPSAPWGWLLLISGVFIAIFFALWRKQSTPLYPATNPGSSWARPQPAGFGAYNGNSSGGTLGSNLGSAPTRSGIGGAVLGGVAGLAAGYGLAKMFDGSTGSHSVTSSAPTQDYLPIDSPSPNDYGSFDAGTGDSWDSGESSGDDSW